MGSTCLPKPIEREQNSFQNERTRKSATAPRTSLFVFFVFLFFVDVLLALENALPKKKIIKEYPRCISCVAWSSRRCCWPHSKFEPALWFFFDPFGKKKKNRKNQMKKKNDTHTHTIVTHHQQKNIIRKKNEFNQNKKKKQLSDFQLYWHCWHHMVLVTLPKTSLVWAKLDLNEKKKWFVCSLFLKKSKPKFKKKKKLSVFFTESATQKLFWCDWCFIFFVVAILLMQMQTTLPFFFRFKKFL